MICLQTETERLSRKGDRARGGGYPQMGAPIYRVGEEFVSCLERLWVSGRDGSGGSE